MAETKKLRQTAFPPEDTYLHFCCAKYWIHVSTQTTQNCTVAKMHSVLASRLPFGKMRDKCTKGPCRGTTNAPRHRSEVQPMHQGTTQRCNQCIKAPHRAAIYAPKHHKRYHTEKHSIISCHQRGQSCYYSASFEASVQLHRHCSVDIKVMQIFAFLESVNELPCKANMCDGKS